MSKYSEALGSWIHKIGNIEHRLTPKMGDNERLSNLMAEYGKRKDQAVMFKSINQFYFDLVCRNYPMLLEEEKDELKTWIEMNQVTIFTDLLVAYHWTSKEDLEKAKQQSGDLIKNLIGATN